MSILKFEFTYNTETKEFSVTNTETGEVKSIKTTPKKSIFKKKDDGSTIPTLTLEDNKYCLNNAAVELMQVQPDDKLDIKYEKRGNKTVVVIGNDEIFGTHSGNRLTKSFTVACRGNKNNELAKFGTEFTIVPHDAKIGLFILNSEKTKEEPNGDENISIEDELDINLSLDNEDANVTEIDASLFKL